LTSSSIKRNCLKTFYGAQRRVIISDCRYDRTNDIDKTMFSSFVRKMDANSRLPIECRSDYRTSDEWVSPAINEASNFKSRFRDYRDGNETGTRKRRSGGIEGKSTDLRQLAGVLDQIPFQKVGFRMSISAADAEFPTFTATCRPDLHR